MEMEVTLEQMPDHSRLWIYQADRPFTTEEEATIKGLAAAFVRQWAAHGQKLQASFAVKHHQFIVLAVDESYAHASGCSIDSSVAFIKHIEQKFNLSLLDRTKIAVYVNDRVNLIPMASIKEAVNSGQIDKNTKVFNNVLENAGAWRANWLLPAKETWLNRYFS